MYSNFVFIVAITSSLIVLVLLIGYAVYEFSPNVKSWEEGVKKVFTFAFESLYEELKGQPVENKRVKEERVLSDSECNMLKSRLIEHPFDTPSLESYIVRDSNDISRIHFSAFRLAKKYESISLEDLEELCRTVIKDFFRDIRFSCTEFYIESAQPKMLKIAIPLTNRAEVKLREEYEARLSMVKHEEENETLEIAVDIFGEHDE